MLLRHCHLLITVATSSATELAYANSALTAHRSRTCLCKLAARHRKHALRDMYPLLLVDGSANLRTHVTTGYVSWSGADSIRSLQGVNPVAGICTVASAMRTGHARIHALLHTWS